MADRKTFLLRLPQNLYDELNRWARDELRSVNAQIEFVLRTAVQKQRRRLHDSTPAQDDEPAGSDGHDTV